MLTFTLCVLTLIGSDKPISNCSKTTQKDATDAAVICNHDPMVDCEALRSRNSIILIYRKEKHGN